MILNLFKKIFLKKISKIEESVVIKLKNDK